jgi:predicted neuraminidase
VHVASIAELKDGTLAAVWYGGKYEGSKDTLLYFATRSPGKDWNPPRGIFGRDPVAKELNRYIKKIGNPLIFTDSEDHLWLIFVTVSVGGWSGSSLNVKISYNGGKTWTKSQRLTLSPFFNVSELVRNNPLPLSDKGFVVPIYHECIGTFSELLWIWPGKNGKPFKYHKTRLTWGKRFIQPSIVALSPSLAAVFFRSHRSNSRIAMSLSEDALNTWTTPQYLDLPNPGAGLNAIKLSDNRILLAYNHHPQGRENLSLAVSEKNGLNWQQVAALEDTPGEEFSYPYMLRTQDGNIHLVYTWRRKRIKHLVFNEAWIIRQTNKEFSTGQGKESKREESAAGSRDPAFGRLIRRDIQ